MHFLAIKFMLIWKIKYGVNFEGILLEKCLMQPNDREFVGLNSKQDDHMNRIVYFKCLQFIKSYTKIL